MVRPVGIREKLRWAISKLVMRAARDQAKTACGSLQLYASLEDGIEGETHDVEHRRRKRTGTEWSQEAGQTRGQKGCRMRVQQKQAGQRGQGRQRESDG